MTTNFIKMHGLKNDFVIIDGREKKIHLSKNQIKKIANRKIGLGCDQIIILEKPKNKKTFGFIKIFNSDGSETKACGNASRCVAFLLMKELKTKKTIIQTKAGLLNAFLKKNKEVSVDIGKAYFKWNQIPLKRKMNTNKLNFKINNFVNPFAVNVGNPHVVFFIKDLKKINLKKIGPKIERHALFPERINVNFAEILSNNKISLKVWERGVGITKACGTGASATTVAAIKKKLINGRICYIQMDGGKLKIEYKKNGHIIMTGPVKMIKKGNLNKFL
jgi:diaminopimelate epimerase